MKRVVSLGLVALAIGAMALASDVRPASACGYRQYELIDLGHGSCPQPNQTFYLSRSTYYCCDGGVVQVGNSSTTCDDLDPVIHGFPPDGSISSSSCGTVTPFCSSCGESPYCDGTEQPVSMPVDSQCGDDEHACGNRGRDGNPVHFDTGVAETNPRTLFAARGNEGLSLAYAVQQRTHAIRPGAGATLTDPKQDRHFLGNGWIDTYADRLVVPSVTTKPIVWLSLDKTVTFPRDATGRSRGGKFQLVDNGAGQVPRWVIKSLSPDEVKRTWEFKERVVAGWNDRIGLLHAMTAAAAGGSSGFRVDVSRVSASDERISLVSDNLGRQLRFYYLASAATAGWIWRLDRVAYRADAALAETNVAQFVYAPGNLLIRIALPVGYVRFNYFPRSARPSPCLHCDGLLTEVIVPVRPYAATPASGMPVQDHERVVEEHVFEFLQNAATRTGTPRVKASRGPTSAWAYHYGPAATTQLDLLMPKSTCAVGATCPSGQACWEVDEGGDNRCYVANVRTLGNGVVGEASFGGAPDEDESYIYDAQGRPKATVSHGSITSYAFDAVTGEVACLVRNDTDYEALTAGQCLDSPVGPLVQVVKPIRAGGVTSKAFPSHLQPGGTRTSSTTYGSHGLVLSQQETGWTQDIEGTPLQQTRVAHHQYDAYGRVLQIDGPLDNTVAYDVTDFVYYTSADNNRGQLRYVRRYLGTSGSHTTFQTEYLDYDIFGVAHRIIGPSGVETLVSTTNRLDWTMTTGAAGVSTTSEVHLNPDGSIRSTIDPDGVCITMDYNPDPGQAIVKRSASTSTECQQVPINTATGDVEIREHVPNDPSRPTHVVRKRDGVTTYDVGGLTYDDARQLTAKSAPGTSSLFTVAYEDALFKGVTAPDWPAVGTWKSEIDADLLGRPTALRRYLDPDNAQTTTLGYTSGWDGTPTSLQRGLNQTVAQTTAFAYDDFGALVQTVSPDSGTTRWEHDVAGRLFKERVGHGTAAQRTQQRTYDSLGRLAAVDNDLEHPVDCQMAPEGTPIADEQYEYDACTGPQGFACSHALGQVAVARVLQHCSQGAVVATARWYAYDGVGRLTASRSGTESGNSFAEDGDFEYDWTAGNRLGAVSSPLSGAYGSVYGHAADTGEVSSVLTSQGAPVVRNIQYAPFGDLTHYTAVGATEGDLLAYDREYGSTGLLTRNTWVDIQRSSLWMDEKYEYSPVGLLVEAEDAARASRSRRYDYDNLLRLTCERTVSAPGEYPACDQGSAYTLGMFTYFNGESESSPPDHRATAFVRGQSYTSTAPESYAYTSGTNQLREIARGASKVIFSTDDGGRRIYDYDSSDPVNSRRDYVYLPNGRLGEIHGRDAASATPYAIILTYGSGGNLTGINDTRGDDYQLYWDDLGRLASAALTVHAHEYRWHYQHLGGHVVAAVRETLGPSPSVDTFYMLQDRRGLNAMVVDSQGGLYYSATYSAHAVPSVEVNSTGLWLPFLLPGQLEIGGSTSAGDRIALVFNGMRVLDRETGAFLSSDPADAVGRKDVEGYAYGRNDPLSLADPTGGETTPRPYWNGAEAIASVFAPGKTLILGGSCGIAKGGSGQADIDERARVAAATRKAIDAVARCSEGACGLVGGGVLMKQWLFSIAVGTVECPNAGETLALPDLRPGRPDYVAVGISTELIVNRGPAFTIAPLSRPDLSFNRWTAIAPAGMGADGVYCLTKMVAHEALHSALNLLPSIYFNDGGSQLGFVQLSARLVFGWGVKTDAESAAAYVGAKFPNDAFPQYDPKIGATENYVRNAVDQCVGC